MVLRNMNKLYSLLFLFLLFSCATAPRQVFTQKIPAESLKLCFIGDTGTRDQAQQDVASMLEKEKCHSIHFVGDIIYSDGLKNRHDKQFQKKFWNYYAKTTEIDHKPNLNIILGNHDHEGSVNAWVELSQKHPKVFFPSPWYLIEMNNICMVHLDTEYYRFYTNYLMRSNEKSWLKSIKKDLKRCDIKIAVGHHPYNSRGKKHSMSTGTMRTSLEETVIGKFDYYISGHEHILSDEGEVKGTRLLISGAGGRQDENEGGYLVMEIKNNTVTYQFRKVSPK
jgi:tartrate-resistant acid phosphatase type 5